MLGTGRAFAALVIVASAPALAGIPQASLASLTRTESAQASEGASDIRVRLDQITQSVTITGVGLRFTGQSPARHDQFQAVRLSWKRSLDGDARWTVTDRDSKQVLATIDGKAMRVMGSSLRMNLKPMPPKLTFRIARGGKVDVIASLELEEYVRGVLPMEMPRSWPLEALKAQAVAARTFALYRKAERERVKASYHLETTTLDQVYLMPVVEEGGDATQANVERAVRETAGMVLHDRRGKAFATFFHADCGGRTEDPKVIWGSGESSGTVVDGACPLNRSGQWRLMLSGEEIAQKLRGQVSKGTKLAVVGIQSLTRTGSGRIGRMKLTWSDGSTETLPAHQFRMSLGAERVKSTNFKVAVSEGKFELSGRGFGHGVGLCQWGTRHLASKGKAFDEILRHYYPRAVLTSSQAL